MSVAELLCLSEEEQMVYTACPPTYWIFGASRDKDGQMRHGDEEGRGGGAGQLSVSMAQWQYLPKFADVCVEKDLLSSGGSEVLDFVYECLLIVFSFSLVAEILKSHLLFWSLL